MTNWDGEKNCICVFIHGSKAGRVFLSFQRMAQGQSLWLRAAPSFPGIFLNNGQTDLLVIEGWAVGLPSWFLCHLPSFRKLKEVFK